MNKYRTIEQFETIVNSAHNGNWNQSAEQAIEYGFYATDFMQMIKEHNELFSYIDQTDLILIIERATQLRNKGAN
jgi:hypothetical protein